MRPFYLAQWSRCPYCGERLPIGRCPKTQKATWDHVHPKSKTGRGRQDNKVLAHSRCNTRKANRLPYPCEILFLEVTTEIAKAITTMKDEIRVT